MTRKDYVLIAKTVKEICKDDKKQAQVTATAFANVLASTNAKFNRTKFLSACGVSE